MNKKTFYGIFIAVVLIGFFIFLSYSLNKNRAGVLESVIDGDTIKIRFPSGKIEVVRLLSINAPEKDMPYYDGAKNYLLALKGKEIIIETHGEDKYGRILAYLLYNNRLINEELLRQGLVHLYIFSEDRYTDLLESAEIEARIGNRGIWEKSTRKEDKCLDITKNNQEVIINNICDFTVLLDDYTLKDEGRTLLYMGKNVGAKTSISVDISDFDYPSSIFFRNPKGKLVSFYRD